MAFTGWGPATSNTDTSSLSLGSSTTPSRGMMDSGGFSHGFGGGWGATGPGTSYVGVANHTTQPHQQLDEMKFNSLYPVGGLVTGEQVKTVFRAFGLPSAQLAHIWNTVDQDRDGKINKSQFCSAMAMIRQAQEQSATTSLPASFSSRSAATGGSGTGTRGDFMADAVPGGLSKSWSVSGLIAATPSSSSTISGHGRGAAVGSGWSMKAHDLAKYRQEFNSVDVNKSEYISGVTARSILTKSGLNKTVLAQIWDLSDVDKDGRLSMEEYCIAMHLMACVKTTGQSLPTSLPLELHPSSSSSSSIKFHTIERASTHKASRTALDTKTADTSVSVKGEPTPNVSGHTRNTSGGHALNLSMGRGSKDGEENVSFEDRRKENFEAGRLELERRRKAIKEKQERDTAETERKQREEEERRLQQECAAELARQAELERQRKKAMEIEKERVLQMKKLAFKREEEQRELEEKRKTEWAKKRLAELEGQRDWEKKHLYSLRVQHSQLEDQLRQLDQKKLSVLASTKRQESNRAQMITDLKSLRLSHDVRRAELTKLQTELNVYHSQLATLQRQRRELREAVQAQSPEMCVYHQQRQELKDKIMHLAASLAGLRSNISHNSKISQELLVNLHDNQQLFQDLKVAFLSDSVVTQELRHQVLDRQHAAEEREQLQREEMLLRQEEEKREREDRERRAEEEKKARDKAMREVKERIKKEARLETIKREQKVAIDMVRALTELTSSKGLTTASSTSADSAIYSTVCKMPSHHTPSSTSAAGVETEDLVDEEEEMHRKVAELQQRKLELQKKRKDNKSSPVRPVPYSAPKQVLQEVTAQEEPKAEPVKPDVSERGKFGWKFSGDKGKATKQEASKQKGKKDKKKELPLNSLDTEQELLDLNSSWEYSDKANPLSSNLPTDMAEILQPLKKVVEEEEEEGGVPNSIAAARTKSLSISPNHVPTRSCESEELIAQDLMGVNKFSVAVLSEMFDKGLSPQEELLRIGIRASDWGSMTDTSSRGIEAALPPAPSSPTTSAQSTREEESLYMNLEEVSQPTATLDYVNIDIVVEPTVKGSAILDIISSPSAQTDTSHDRAHLSSNYLALYDYQARDNTELSLTEGDMVTVLPRDDASSGWVMVRCVDGSEGWVPESYLELHIDSAVAGEMPVDSIVEGVEKTCEVGKGGGGGELTKSIQPEISSSLSAVDPSPLAASVLYTWKGSKPNHLSLVKGEVIQVLQQGDKWWSGQVGGEIGWFPKTFVKLLDTATTLQPHSSPSPRPSPHPSPHSSPSHHVAVPAPSPGHQATPTSEVTSTGASAKGPDSELYEAIYEFVGTSEGDLSFYVGDIIKVTSTEGDWWTGNLDGSTGNFPSNYVQRMPTAEQPSIYAVPTSMRSLSISSSSSIEVHENKPSKPLIAHVRVAYQSSKPSQLSLEPGELVKVVKQASNGWWEGELQSRGKKRAVGWFPANRVELLPQRQTSTSSSSSITSINIPLGGWAESILARSKSPLLEVLEESKSGAGSSSAVNLVLALYTYTAQSPDELSFHKGSVISVLSKEGEWWKGTVNDKTGLFPSNYVQPLTEQRLSVEPTRWADSVSPAVLATVSDKERKRQEAIFELVSSERYYVDSLKLVKEVFFDPMAEQEVLTEEEMAKVRVNWDELIQCSSGLLSHFLVRLRTFGEVVSSIGDVLVSQIPHLTPHIRWCGCQLNACTLLQQKASEPRYKEFEQRCCTDPRTGGLPLSSFLLKPMQRVTKYPLLVKRILEYSDPSDQDYLALEVALKKAETLCVHVNDGVQQKENMEQLEWLQTHVQFFNLDEEIVFNSQTNFMGPRKLLHWGKFFKIRGSKDLVGFLFNDFFLLVRPKLFFPRAATPADLQPWDKNEFQLYRKPFLLDGLKAKMVTENSSVAGALLSLQQSSPEEKDMLLRVEGEQTRTLWLRKFTKASLDYITTKKKMEREKQEKYMQTLRDSVGTLVVTVMNGVDLLAKDPNGKSDPFCVVKFGTQQKEQTTPVIHNSLNPRWNYKMEFAVHDINKDMLEITVFDKDLFSPNDFLGYGRVSLKDLIRDKDSPWEKTVLLEGVASGEITVQIALSLNKDSLLL